jgi:hypothetical protein
VLSHSIHGRGDKWSLEGDTLGDGRVQDDLRGSEANVAWLDKEIIVGKTSMFLRVDKILNVQPIAFRIIRKVFDGLKT